MKVNVKLSTGETRVFDIFKPEELTEGEIVNQLVKHINADKKLNVRAERIDKPTYKLKLKTNKDGDSRVDSEREPE